MYKNPFDDDESEEDGNDSSVSSAKAVSGGRHDVQLQIMDSKARALASQQRALRSIAHSEQIGSETAAELVDQGQKLTRAENKLYEIEGLQQESQRHINSLSSVFGGIKNIFRRGQPPAPVPPPVRNNADRSRTEVPSDASGSLMNKGQNTLTTPAPQSDFEKNLDQMSVGMSRLKSLALDMNAEIGTQNKQLDRMGNRVESVNTTMNHQNKQMNKLLGR